MFDATRCSFREALRIPPSSTTATNTRRSRRSILNKPRFENNLCIIIQYRRTFYVPKIRVVEVNNRLALARHDLHEGTDRHGVGRTLSQNLTPIAGPSLPAARLLAGPRC